MFLCRSHAQTLWEALCACWHLVHTGFRTSAGRLCPQKAAQDRTCSWSPSRSSNVLMTLPRLPSSLSPSLQRKIPTNSTYRAAKPLASQFLYIFKWFCCFCICGICMRSFLFMVKYWYYLKTTVDKIWTSRGNSQQLYFAEIPSFWNSTVCFEVNKNMQQLENWGTDDL